MVGYLEIPVAGKLGSVKLMVYPQSSKAKVFEEQEPQAGESQWPQYLCYVVDAKNFLFIGLF